MPQDARYDKDYTVGRLLLTMRTRTRLRQAELAEQLGVSRRSIQKWEGGDGYPGEANLRRLLALFVVHGGFEAGREREQAAELWELVAQFGPRLSLFDAAWFNEQLQHEPALSFPTSQPLIDVSEAPDIGLLYGREATQATLAQWVLTDGCRVVGLLGMGGIGKTSLAAVFARAHASAFARVVFRSLRNAPPLAQLLDGLLRFLSGQPQLRLPQSLDDKLALLLQLLTEQRCLLVLDNLETIMQEGIAAGSYRAGYADYGQLIQRLAESPHRSCLLLTSREKPREFGPLEGTTAPVRSLALHGVAEDACQAILADRAVFGEHGDWLALTTRYGGNPLALKLVAEPIRELFGGDIHAFLDGDGALFGGIRYLLDQQLARLSAPEQDVLYWMAVGREPLSLEALRAWSVLTISTRERLEAVEALRRRFLIERANADATFTLQPVVMEYVTERLIGAVANELLGSAGDYLRRYALLQAQARTYVRQTQARLIVKPLLEQLVNQFKHEAAVEACLLDALARLRAIPQGEQGYGGGNIVNLLVQHGSDLRGRDLRGLNLWQAYLSGVELPWTQLQGADLRGALFSENFKTIIPVMFSPDATLLAAGSIDGEIGLWRVADGQQVALWGGHSGPVNALAWHPDGRALASAGSDGQIIMWAATSGTRLAVLQGHEGRVWGVAWSPDGARLASGGDDGTLRLWNLLDGTPARVFDAHGSAVAAVTWAPDGTQIASASHDPLPTIKLWDATSGVCRHTIDAHEADIWALAWSPDGTQLASGSADLSVKLWDAETGDHTATCLSHTARVRALAWSPDGRQLVSGSLDQTMRVWDAQSGACVALLAENTGPVNGVAWSSDGDTLAGGGELQTIALWSARRVECLALLEGYNSGVLALAYRPDGGLLASAGFDRTVRLWSLDSSATTQRLVGHYSVVYGVAWSPDGALVASVSGGNDGTLRVWDTASGTELTRFNDHNGPVLAVSWSADGRLLASGSLDRSVKLWSPLGARSLATLEGHDGAVRGVAFSPNGARLASGSYDRTLRVWDTATRTSFATCIGHTAPVRTVVWHPHEAIIASGGADQSVRLWDAQSGALLATLHGHSAEVPALCFSPDGALLASGSFDGTIRLWDVVVALDATRAPVEPLAVLRPHTGVIYALAVHPNGQVLASGSADGVLHTWDLRALRDQSAHHMLPLTTLRGEGPYVGMNISGVTGLTAAQRATLRALGAVEQGPQG
jgi:WD40 repeat protein/transcriptional regulator with XRE-family HTH domain